MGIDTIAGRDLGFAHRNKQPPTAPAAMVAPAPPPAGPAADRERERTIPEPRAPLPPPRRASPEPRRRREPSPPPAKRFKPSSPPPPARRGDRGGGYSRDRGGRDRWDDGGNAPPPRRAPSPPPHRESIPPALAWFLSTLPSASAFDGKNRRFRHYPWRGIHHSHRIDPRSCLPY